MPGTCFGDEYSVLSLIPNCPLVLYPHVNNVPSVLTPIVPYKSDDTSLQVPGI